MDRAMLSFNVTLLAAIQLMVLLLSRLCLALLSHQFEMTEVKYWVWVVCEMVVMGLFMGLYLTLMYAGAIPYFNVVGRCLWTGVLIWVFPYLIFWFIMQLRAGQEQEEDGQGRIRFTDSSNRLKLMITPSSILYVEAHENYVNIHYLDGDRVKMYTLRSSMRSMESLLVRYGLVRCQRSYFVAPSHVKVLRKDKDGSIVAELDTASCPPIPVSKTYYDNLAHLL